MDGLEGSLNCPICSDLFVNPFSLRCGHSFCSLCIRKHMDKTLNFTTSGICPVCRENAQSDHLRPSHTLAVVVENYSTVRRDIFSAIFVDNSSSVVGVSTDKSKRTRGDKGICGNTADIIDNPTCNLPPIRRMAHPHFHGMSKDKVKKFIERACQSAGSRVMLRLDGADVSVLERRFREFVHLNNAQLDSLHPLTIDQVIGEVNHAEHMRDIADSAFNKTKISQQNKRIAELKQGKVDKAIKSSFNDLIAQVRQKKMKMKGADSTHSSGNDVGCGELAPVLSVDTPNFISESARIQDEKKRLNESRTDDYSSIYSVKEFGAWRVMFSRVAGKPFFYNASSKIGQFEFPQELLQPTQEHLELELELDSVSVLDGCNAASEPLEPSEPCTDNMDVGCKRRRTRQSNVSSIAKLVDNHSSTPVDLSLTPPPSSNSSGTVTRSASKRKNNESGHAELNVLLMDEMECSGEIGPDEESKLSLSQSQSVNSRLPPTQVSSTQIEQQWSCPQCTFINEYHNLSCEVCGGRCPKSLSKVSIRWLYEPLI